MGFYCIFLLIASFAQAGSAQCEVFFVSRTNSVLAANDLIYEQNAKAVVEETVKQDPTLADILNRDSDLKALSQDPNFINYIIGLAEGRSFAELKYSFFEVWKKALASDVNLNRLLTKDLLAEIQALQGRPQFHSATRVQKIKYSFSSLKVQISGFFKRLFFVRNLIRTELSPRTLDGRVFDFYGYLNLKLDVSALRPWNSVPGSFGAIQLGQVREMNPAHFARVAMLAAEIEQPVDAYSDNSGEVLRVISPQASRFMGKTEEEATAHRRLQQEAHSQGRPREAYCTNSWCVEENRHEGTLARIAQSLVGWHLKVGEVFDSYPNLNPMNPKDAYFHLYARNDTEWHAGSAYFLLASHADGPLREWILNVTRDEVKHMSLFGGLYKYLRGDTYWTRLSEMIKKTLIEIREKSSGSEYGALGFADGITMLEISYIHLIYEANIRRFFGSLPLKSLRKIYETEVNLKPLPTDPIDPEKQQQMNIAIEKETVMRKALARWPKSQREFYNRLEYFEITNNSWLTQFIVDHYDSFEGAEEYMGVMHQQLLSEIDRLQAVEIEVRYGVRLSRAEMRLLKSSLKETLRDYQIMNNATVRNLGLNVVFIDAVKGFDVARDAAYDAVKKVREKP